MPEVLCDYGCGRKAKYQLKNGKWCCSKSYHSCPAIKEKIKNTLHKTISNMSKKEFQKKYGHSGEENGMYDKCHTGKVKQRIREVTKGRFTLQWYINKYGLELGPWYYKEKCEKCANKGEDNPNYNGQCYNYNSSWDEKVIRRFFQLKYPNDNWNCKQIKKKELKENYNYNHFIQPDMRSDIKRVVFEYDGPWHFKQIGSKKFHNLKKVQKRDKILEQYCKDNNIRLIRIDTKIFNENRSYWLMILEKTIYQLDTKILTIGCRY